MSETAPVGGRSAGYRFGPRDQRGLLAGIRAGQAAVVAVALVLAVLVAHVLRGAAAVPVAALVAVVGGLVAFVPLVGRTADEWFPVLARYLVGALDGGRRQRAGTAVAPALRLPPRPFRGLAVVAVTPAGGATFGAVEDRRAGTLTGVLAVEGGAFALADPAEQDRRVAAWSSVLAALAGGDREVVRLQWVERTVPEEALPRPAGLTFPETGAARSSYRALLRATPERLRHELLVAVSVRAPRRAPRDRRGDAAAVPGAGPVLSRTLAALERRLSEAGVVVEGALSPGALRATLRRGYEAGPLQGPAPRDAWPWRCQVRWSCARVAGTLQRTYWIAEWPRTEVGADFLLPLLLVADERRAVSIVMAPVAPDAAVRAVEHARTSATADDELRARHGFARTARARRQHDAVLQREAELAAGHGAFRFSGYLAVAARDDAALARAAARVEQAAALARLSLRRLDGCQGEGLAACLPLGRGCT